MLEGLDLPPVWMVGFALLGWGLAQFWPIALPGGPLIGGGLVVAGGVLMVLAAGQMVLARTTFIPRRDPTALVTGGVFSLSRNPIYLADAIILAGVLLYAQGLWVLWLVPVYGALITRRFILGEEARIAAHFGAEWRAYAARTRRWI
ncbi:methyltransferase family protein [Phaeovulum sp.]|uniref:methyltransferase family protein n=1 Tax=Phaeovulum sp. TaxID=2934796 RepID=UPI0039E2F6AF